MVRAVDKANAMLTLSSAL